jgi:16S rRNA (guanine1207-N2)-methyltransferase
MTANVSIWCWCCRRASATRRARCWRAVASVAPGGRVVACQANDEGAKSGEADLKALAGAGGVLTKQHCRVFWTQPLHGAADADLLAKWRALDAPRRIADGRYLSRPGVFAWDRLDAGSRLLVEHLPADLGGRAADLGAGFGYLSDALLRRNPGIVALDLHEAEARALAMARHNLAGQAQRVALGFLWHDVTAGLVQRYDVIVTNPPFHAPGRAERGHRPPLHRGRGRALNPGGRLWLVANRHLPYEAVLDEAFGQARIVAERDGYKVVEARKAR